MSEAPVEPKTATLRSVTILTARLGIGGVTPVTIRLSNAFAAMGLDVTVIVSHPGGDRECELDRRVKLVRGKNSAWRSLPVVVDHLRASEPSALLSMTEKYAAIGWAATRLSRRPVPHIATFHTSLETELQAGGWHTRLVYLLGRTLGRRADGFIAVSEGLRSEVMRRYSLPVQATWAVPNPALPSWHPPALAPEDVRRHLQETFVPPECAQPFVVCVARLTSQKGIDLVLRALAMIEPDQRPHLVIVGDGPDRNNLEQFAREMGLGLFVTFVGYAAPQRYLAHAKGLVLASRWEGFGNVLVEAMAADLPVVATDCHWGPSEILQNGELGQLVRAGDVPALARALIQLGERPYPPGQLVRRAREFAPEPIAARYAAIMEEVIQGPPHHSHEEAS